MIKQILRKLIYREKSSGEKYIAYCKRESGPPCRRSFPKMYRLSPAAWPRDTSVRPAPVP